MPEQPVTPDILTDARELHRRRLAAGQGVAPNFKTAIAEIAVLEFYGRRAQGSDLSVGARSLQWRPTDNGGRRYRVIERSGWPMRVYSRRLDVDLFVFCGVSRDVKTVQVYGWMPCAEVEEAPVAWIEEDGVRVDFCHEIEREFLAPMSEEYEFKSGCSHGFGVWEYGYDAWNCFGCGRYVHDAWDREHIAGQSGRGDPVPA